MPSRSRQGSSLSDEALRLDSGRWSGLLITSLLLLLVIIFSFAGSVTAADFIVVTGAAGEPKYGEQFQAWADRITQVANDSGRDCVTIDDRPVDDATPADTPPDRDRLRAAIAASRSSDTGEPLWIILLGHGTFANSVAKFNLRGPDVSATELAGWLEGLDRPLVFVNASSCSGPFIESLAGAGRVIVTATKSGTEQNFARFGDSFSTAVGSGQYDLDHDDAVSVLEAFRAASAMTQASYSEQDRLATEHALIDDDGDGRGTPAAAIGRSGDGDLSARIALPLPDAGPPLTPEQAAARDRLEDELAEIRLRRSEMNDDEYFEAIEPILINLARIYTAAEESD